MFNATGRSRRRLPWRRASWGRWLARHPWALHALVLATLAWSGLYLAWRVGWSSVGASSILWSALLAGELYGVWNLATLAWLTWEIPETHRPSATPGWKVDVYVCTFDEPVAVLEATLAGCALLSYPHATYVLDDGRRPEIAELARSWGARYLTRPDRRHAKAGNINHALPRTSGELVLVLDADHVPLPDALDTLVGYFDAPDVALVQGPHDFSNHDSVQHYDLGRHEQSVFYSVISPGKDRHNAAFWCGSGALIRRRALLDVGGVATETIAEDFHTTIKLHRAGWRTRYDPRIVLQGRAPHNLAAYLLQRDRWARGNLAVFTTPESPLRARGLTPAQRLSYFASLSSYLAGPMRLLTLMILAAVLWTGALPLRMAPLALALLWAPATLLLIIAGAALCRGEQSSRETVHYELCTAEIFTRALRCILRPGRTTFQVTPKEGIDPGGWEALRQFRLLLALAVLLAGGVGVRLADDAGLHVAIVGHMPGFAAWFAPLLGVIELRRVVRTLTLVTRRRQLRTQYRTPIAASAAVTPGASASALSDASASAKTAGANTLSDAGTSAKTAGAKALSDAGTSAAGAPVMARVCDISLSGIGLELPRPLEPGTTARLTVHLPTLTTRTIPVQLDVIARSCAPKGERWRIGAEIVHCEDQTRRRIVEYCHIVWPYQRVRDRGPERSAQPQIATAPSERTAIAQAATQA